MTASHGRYEELVVGHALSALEPEDEQLLLQHLPTCAACERELRMHRETLAHLAQVEDDQAPPPGLWESIRQQVVAESGPAAFADPVPAAAPVPAPALPVGVSDLSAARSRRLSPRARTVGTWASVAAAVAVVATVSVGVTHMVDDRNRPAATVSQQLQDEVRALEAAPGQTVPLAPKDGKAVAVAVVQEGHVSLVVDGLERNDRDSSVYVLWGQSGAEPTRALGTFDVEGSVDVVRDVAVMPSGTAMPQLYVITKEAGRTAPPVAQGPALATGRGA